MTRELSVAKKLAAVAARMQMRSRSRARASLRFKAHYEMVTAVDRAIERTVIQGLKRAFPNDAIISEETGARNGTSGRTWVVDPIDGTSNYVIGNPLFGVSIGLVKDGNPLLGVSFFPALHEEVWAVSGRGAFSNGKRIRVSSTKKFAGAIHTFCHGKHAADRKLAVALYRRYLEKGFQLRHFGSAAYEMALLARGGTDTYLGTGSLHSWDFVPGVVLIREAGGVVTDWKGKEWTVQSKSIATGNRQLHAQLLRFITAR